MAYPDLHLCLVQRVSRPDVDSKRHHRYAAGIVSLDVADSLSFDVANTAMEDSDRAIKFRRPKGLAEQRTFQSLTLAYDKIVRLSTGT